MSNNKYASYTETVHSQDILSVASLSTIGTPPANLNFTFANSATGGDGQYSKLLQTDTTIRKQFFNSFDVPRIRGIGAFCNIGDCLVDITDYTTKRGLIFQLAWQGYDINGLLVGDLIPAANKPVFQFRELNVILEQDISLLELTTDATLLAVLPTTANTRLFISAHSALDVTYSGILVDPQFATKRASFWCETIVESTFGLDTQ